MKIGELNAFFKSKKAHFYINLAAIGLFTLAIWPFLFKNYLIEKIKLIPIKVLVVFRMLWFY